MRTTAYIAAFILATAVTLASGTLSFGLEKKLFDSAGVQVLDEKAPEFVLDGKGGRLKLEDLRGSVVLLHIWATWCSPCREEFPQFERIYKRYSSKGFALVPVAIDKGIGRDELKAKAVELGASFPVYLASDGVITDRYWTWGVPETYFIDKKGRIRARAIGPRNWSSEGVDALINALIDEK